MPRYIDLTPTQYEHALEWLRALDLVGPTGLSDGRNGPLLIQTLLERYLELHSPIWLDELGGLIENEGDLPIDLLDISARIGLDDKAVFTSAHNVARKFDDLRLKEIGRAGELVFFEWASQRASRPVIWVAETDDTAGYDILISEPGARAEVEVKTTTARNRVRFFLSRNEFEHLQSSSSWCLQIVALDESGSARFYYVPSQWVVSVAPNDTDASAKWSSVQVTVPRRILSDGPHPRVLQALLI
jgi:hypothetical protein